MIVEQRTYVVKAGRTAEFLAAVETLGLPVMRPLLGGLIGYFVTEIGALNEVVHLWAYESLDDRARRPSVHVGDEADAARIAFA